MITTIVKRLNEACVIRSLQKSWLRPAKALIQSIHSQMIKSAHISLYYLNSSLFSFKLNGFSSRMSVWIKFCILFLGSLMFQPNNQSPSESILIHYELRLPPFMGYLRTTNQLRQVLVLASNWELHSHTHIHICNGTF